METEKQLFKANCQLESLKSITNLQQTVHGSPNKEIDIRVRQVREEFEQNSVQAKQLVHE
jgi:hypothetical protein